MMTGGVDENGPYLQEVGPLAVGGWNIFVWIEGERVWQYCKFTTIKKKRRVKELIRTLKHKYGLKFKAERGWQIGPAIKENEKQYGTQEEIGEEVIERVKGLVGEVIPNEAEKEKHYWHNGRCKIGCVLDIRPTQASGDSLYGKRARD